ncbi:hypothetical protein [Streptomyces mirabilis]|uniref:hypothetical protein n=1 Tax=Streptomyces mirabilis TaxID=68239 RepID=UPI0036C06E85
MSEIADAAVGFPTVAFTAVLVVLAGFWMLTLLGRAEQDHSRAAADAVGPGVKVIPVAAAATLVIVLAWIVCLTGSVLLRRFEASGLTYALLAVLVFVASPALAYAAARVLMPRWHRLRSRSPLAGRHPERAGTTKRRLRP